MSNSKPYIPLQSARSDTSIKIDPPKILNPLNGDKVNFEKLTPIKRDVTDELDNNPSMWEVVWWAIKAIPTLLVLLYKFTQLINGNTMKDKTTFMATVKVVLGIIATIIGLFGSKFTLTPEVQEAITAIFASGYFLFSWIQGLFTTTKEEAK